MNDKLTPTPGYLYRHYLYKKNINNILPCRFLEIGCGSGNLLFYLAQKGFEGKGIDFSEFAIDKIKSKLKNNNLNIQINKDDVFSLQEKDSYDLVIFLMVLEHIKEDKLALKKVNSFLKKGGTFFFAIPAHKKYWNNSDIQKGHFRRYEREDVLRLLCDSGFEVENIYCYGFPFLLWLLKIKDIFDSIRKRSSSYKQKEYLSKISAIDKEYPFIFRHFFNGIIFYPFFKIMDLFLKTDFGIGYVVMAKKVRDLI